jgi:hypothetical protein
MAKRVGTATTPVAPRWRLPVVVEDFDRRSELTPSERVALATYAWRNSGLGGDRPCPCLGDAAFDAADVLLWQAEGAEAIVKRVELLAPAIGWRPTASSIGARRLQPDCNPTGLHWPWRGGTRRDSTAANAVQDRTERDSRH